MLSTAAIVVLSYESCAHSCFRIRRYLYNAIRRNETTTYDNLDPYTVSKSFDGPPDTGMIDSVALGEGGDVKEGTMVVVCIVILLHLYARIKY